MLSALLAVLGVVIALATGFVGGFARGYARGVDDEAANHDFDRCPHCKRFLEQDEDGEDEEPAS